MTAQDLPAIMIKGQSPFDGRGVTTGLSAIMLSATARAAAAASIAQLVVEDLLRHLHLKLHENFKARRRSRFFLGKIGNVVMGSDTDYIEMKGSHLLQTLKLFGTDAEGLLDLRETYLLRADIAREAHDRLGAQLGVDPDKLAMGLEPR